MRTALILGAVLALVGIVAPVARAEEQQQPKPYVVGDTIADFTLVNTEGKDVKLSDYKDKVVVAVLFAHW